MAVFAGIGVDTSDGTKNTSSSNGNAFGKDNDGYTASESGTVTSLHASVSAVGLASNIEIAIYDASQNLLGTTGSMSITTGDNGGTVDVSVTQGAVYSILVCTDSNVTMNTLSTGAINMRDSAATTWAIFPEDPISSSWAFEQDDEITVWADSDATGGGVPIPSIVHHLNNLNNQ